MNKKTRFASACMLTIAMLVLTLDTKTAILGANSGLEICLKALIPSLFPFLVLSAACCELLSGIRSKALSQLMRPCRLPDGAQTVFIIGLLSGYPVGAKLIGDAYRRENLTKADAERMLMFCSNAGPSFIFGVIGPLFAERWVPWLMWLVHIISAYIVAVLTVAPAAPRSICTPTNGFKFTKVLETMGLICGWVILFKILLTFFDKWFLNMLPSPWQIIISGILELSNGCLRLAQLENCGLRFLFGLVIITFGGLCIVMQTTALIGKLSIKRYLYGKLLQVLISLLIALPLQALQFSSPYRNWHIPFLFSVTLMGLLLLKQFSKKVVAFPQKMIYNTEKG